jgi:ubiquinone/menaquinone biosynthesis C-methylase UbiE
MNINSAVKHTEIPSLDAIKAKQKITWEDGDYAAFAKYMEPGAIEVLESWDISSKDKLLDVGCGSGQTAIPAAKMGFKVTGVDIAENLIQYARKRAIEAKITARFDVGDAEDLPYEDNKFDAAISMFGAMFAPRPDYVTNEFARVLKPGGKLYMANWTPNSMPAQMFKRVSEVVPPAPGFIPPVLWGDENTVKQRLFNDFAGIKLVRKFYPQWQFPFDASELVDLFRTYFGPVKSAFDSLDDHQQTLLHKDLESIYRANSELRNGILTITGGEYLEVIATRR